MKTSALILLAIGMVFLGAGIAITSQHLVLPECCTCPPQGYEFQSFYAWLRKINTLLDCSGACDPFGECTESRYIIPTDIFSLSLIFTGAGAALHFAKLIPQNLTKKLLNK